MPEYENFEFKVISIIKRKSKSAEKKSKSEKVDIYNKKKSPSKNDKKEFKY